jgi:hypothetical protein
VFIVCAALQNGASGGGAFFGGAKIGPARYPFTAWWQHGLARRFIARLLEMLPNLKLVLIDNHHPEM